MTKTQAQRWANYTAGELLRTSWDKADWAEKTGPDADRLDKAMQRICDRLAKHGPHPTDPGPRT